MPRVPPSGIARMERDESSTGAPVAQASAIDANESAMLAVAADEEGGVLTNASRLASAPMTATATAAADGFQSGLVEITVGEVPLPDLTGGDVNVVSVPTGGARPSNPHVPTPPDLTAVSPDTPAPSGQRQSWTASLWARWRKPKQAAAVVSAVAPTTSTKTAPALPPAAPATMAATAVPTAVDEPSATQDSANSAPALIVAPAYQTLSTQFPSTINLFATPLVYPATTHSDLQSTQSEQEQDVQPILAGEYLAQCMCVHVRV